MPILVALFEWGFLIYDWRSKYLLIKDLKKQLEYYLGKGYSPEKATALAFQDEGVEIAAQVNYLNE